MLDFFDRFFRKMRNAAGYEDVLYFVSMTTGTVPANLGMIISAVSYFGNNCEAIYLSGGAPRRTEMVGKLMDKRYFQVALKKQISAGRVEFCLILKMST